MKKIKWLSIGLAAVAFLSSGFSVYADDEAGTESVSGIVSASEADEQDDDTAEMEKQLSTLTQKLSVLGQKRTDARKELESLKAEQASLKEQEEEMRAGLSRSIQNDYEASPDAGVFENLFLSDSAYLAGSERNQDLYAKKPLTVESYLTVYEQYVDKTEEVQKKRVAIRQLDSQIAALEKPADEIGAAIQAKKVEKEQQILAAKQAAAGTLQATTLRQYLGEFTTTGYCPCEICCGEYGTGATAGYTASGTKATAGRTVAMGGVPFGTKLEIDGHIYTVEDRGTPYGHVDIYYNTHSEAFAHGLQTAKVYLITE